MDLSKGAKNFVPQTKTELKRLGTQGAMELANALFNGSAFVPSGPGQYTPTQQNENGNKGQESVQPPRENEGAEM